MIIYHPAFDLYHTIFRFLQFLTHFKRNEYVELDRLRIWDFYLLFPEKMSTIRLKKSEDDIKKLIRNYISRENNPYDVLMDDRKMFEKIRQYQFTAIRCLASYGIIDKDYLTTNRVTIISKELIADYLGKFEPLTPKETNVIHLLTSHFYLMSMFGQDGLKARTKLLESKYDA